MLGVELWQQGGGWDSSVPARTWGTQQREVLRGSYRDTSQTQRVGWSQCQAASSSLWEAPPYQEWCDPKISESCQDFGNSDGMKDIKSKPWL